MPTMSTKPGPELGMQEEEEECTYPCWRSLPDHLLLHIFSFLGASSLAKAGLICKAWLRVAFDELLWKDLFYRHWGISRMIPMAPGKYSWIQEYKRLLYHTPSVESEVLKQHADQVLHVSFSHNGKMFATCSKDGFIRVWDATYPTSLKYKADMRKFTWKYTQFSQFNSTDMLLLVSGVHFGSLSTSGEIAVFSLEGEFVMQSRVMNKPYDVFGTWYNDFYLLSGNLHWTGHLNSCSAIWLNKAYQETMSEEESVVMRLFKFSNINASSIRTIMIANCLSKDTGPVEEKSTAEDNNMIDNPSNVRSLLIGEYSTNQEEEDMTEEQEEPNDTGKSENESNTPVQVKKSATKTLQKIQVFERGEFITKFLEVDADEPNNRLNGTIEYSNDYRQAEGPKVYLRTGVFGDTSGSELSTNGNHSGSEMGSVNGSSDVFDQSHSSLEAEIGTKTSRAELEDSQPESSLSVRPSPQQPSPYEDERVHFVLSDFLDENSELSLLEKPSQCVTDSLGAEQEAESSVVTTDTLSEERDEVMSEVESEASSHTVIHASSPKRVLHGQQQQHGEPVRNPSTCEQEAIIGLHGCANSPSGSSDSLELPEKTPRLAFCCVDVKKQRKAGSVKHSHIRSETSSRFSKSRNCLGRELVETLHDNAKLKRESAMGEQPVKNMQSKMCLGRQSVETMEIMTEADVVIDSSLERAQSRICANLENQSSSDVEIDCVPGRVQSRMCAGIGTASMENIEYQSNDNEIKITCKPVRNSCSTQSENTVSQSSSSSHTSGSLSGETAKKFQYKSKKSKKGKSKKIKDKYLIFTKGSETYTPHQIGIKRIKPFQAFNEDGSRLIPNVSENTQQAERGDDVYDEVDQLIDMHGHIIGMTLSPDHSHFPSRPKQNTIY